MLKQVLKVMIVPVVLLALASPAWAGGLTVIFDPLIPPPPPSSGPYYIVTPTGGPYTVSWSDCSAFGLQYTAPALYTYLMNNAGSSPTACMGFMNGTGATINFLDLNITTSVSQPVTCTTLDQTLNNSECVQNTPGELDFFGTLGIPYSYPPPTGTGLTQFFFAEIGVSASDISTTVQVPSYDPSTLMLLATGMAFLAMGGLRRTT